MSKRAMGWTCFAAALGLLLVASPAALGQTPATSAAAAAASASTAGARAAAPAPATLSRNAADIAWLMLTGTLVMFMQAGFALVESGLTRSKNTINIMAKNLMDFCFGALLFWAFGYCIMYGGNCTSFFGWDNGLVFMNKGMDIAGSASAFHESASWFFQMVFAATAATIVSGAMAERTKLASYLVYSIVISGLMYPITGHWIWGGDGWLSAMGMRDFAGSTVVHSVGAWAALAGAIVIGPRLGKYNKDRSSNAIPGHNIALAALGVFILWFGWYGFNPGSTLTLNRTVAYIAVTTTLAAAAGGVAALLVSWKMDGKPDLTMALNGVLGGLVGITAPCASVAPWAAVVIGLIAGAGVYFAVLFIDKVLRIDDPVGAIAVHGCCGAWGTISVGLFGSHAIDAAIGGEKGSIQSGLFYGGGFHQLGVQVLGVAAVFVFTFAAGMILFLAIKHTIGLRVSEAEEIEGLDLGEHDMSAYPDFQRTFIKSYHAREI